MIVAYIGAGLCAVPCKLRTAGLPWLGPVMQAHVMSTLVYLSSEVYMHGHCNRFLCIWLAHHTCYARTAHGQKASVLPVGLVAASRCGASCLQALSRIAKGLIASHSGQVSADDAIPEALAKQSVLIKHKSIDFTRQVLLLQLGNAASTLLLRCCLDAACEMLPLRCCL